MKSKIATLLTLAVLTAMITSLILPIFVNAQGGNLLQYEWTMPGASGALNYSTDGPAPDKPNVLWTTTIPGLDFGSQDGDLVAFNGMVFARGTGGVFAVDAFTGEIVYKIIITGGGGPMGGGGAGRIVKVSDSVMVIGSDGYNIATGAKLWNGSQPASAHWIPEANLFVDGASPGGGTAYYLNDPLQPPVLLWDTTNMLEQEYLYAYGEGLIFTIKFSTTHAINASTGEVVWEAFTGSFADKANSYYKGRVYSGGMDGKMYCWNATTGEPIWVFNAGSGYHFWAGRIATWDDKVYSINQDSYVYCLDAVTGDLVWKFKGNGVYYTGHAIVGGGKLYAQTGDVEYRDPDTGMRVKDQYVCLNATTGELLWELPFGVAAPSGNHCLAYGNLYLQPATTEETISAGVFSRIAIGETLMCISGQPRDWSMFRGDPTHLAEGDAGPINLALKWKFQTGGAITSSPSIADGIVYVGSHDKKIYANDAEDGSEIWSFETGYKVFASPAVVNGKVYTGSDDGNVYCLNAKTGAKLWQNSEPGDIDWINWGALQSFTIRTSPTVVDGKVYVGSLDKTLYCLNANTGVTMWTFDSGGYIYSTPAVADGAVYVATATGRPAARLYKLDANNGTVLWSKMIFYQRGPGPLVPWATPVVADGMVFQSIDGFDHYGINATDGATLWKYRSINWAVIGASPLYAEGNVYIADLFSLVAIDAKTGATNVTDPSIKWFTFLGREIYSGPAYSGGKIYVPTMIQALYVLDAKTGEKLSFAEMGELVTSSPGIYDGKAYVGGWGGNLFCYEEAPPQIISPPVPPPTWPSAEEIAQTVINKLPTNPSANDIASVIMNQLPAYPEGPTAEEVAQATINKLPAYPQAPSAQEVTQEILKQWPEYPEPTVVPEYTIMDIVILVGVAIAIVIGLVSLFRKQK